MDNLATLTDWLRKHNENEPNNCVLLLEFTKICRLCLKESTQMFGLKNHLVEFEEGSLFLMEVIELLTDIKDDERDQNFPLKICFECSEMVLKYYEFKIQCKKTKEALLLYNKIISQDIINNLETAIMSNSNECELKVEQRECKDFEEHSSNDGQEMSMDCDKSENIQAFNIEIFDNSNEGILTTDRDTSPLSCSHCSKSFTKKIDLSKHLKSIHKDKTLACNICNQTFTQIQTLKRHSKIHQSDQKNKLCPFCGKCFVRTDDLRRHIRTHTNERPYACSQCDKKYKQTSELKEHMKSHSNLKSYMCNICGKTLATRNGIYVHMKVHNGIKNHECQTCGTKYVTAGQLASHIKHIHSKQKPFTCSYEDCLKSFVTNIALRAHLRSHVSGSDEKKQFICSVCGKCLATSVKLSEHKRIHVENEDLNRCTICEIKFENEQELSTHKCIHDGQGCADNYLKIKDKCKR